MKILLPLIALCLAGALLFGGALADAKKCNRAHPCLSEPTTEPTAEPTAPEPTTEPTGPEPTAPEPSGTLYFYDGFEREADTYIPPWSNGCYDGPGGASEITTDPAVARSGSYSAKFTVYDGYCTAYPTRANLRWSEKFHEGDERYIGYSMYLPADFPADNPGWMNLGQFGYGPPWGYPPIHFSYWGDGTRQAMTVYDENTTSLGNIPVALGAWNDLVLHEKFSSDPGVGYLEVWKDGQPVTFKNGSARVYTNTLRTDATGAGSFDLQQYRQGGVWPSPLSVWFDEAKVGDSYGAVAP